MHRAIQRDLMSQDLDNPDTQRIEKRGLMANAHVSIYSIISTPTGLMQIGSMKNMHMLGICQSQDIPNDCDCCCYESKNRYLRQCLTVSIHVGYIARGLNFHSRLTHAKLNFQFLEQNL